MVSANCVSDTFIGCVYLYFSKYGNESTAFFQFQLYSLVGRVKKTLHALEEKSRNETYYWGRGGTCSAWLLPAGVSLTKTMARPPSRTRSERGRCVKKCDKRSPDWVKPPPRKPTTTECDLMRLLCKHGLDEEWHVERAPALDLIFFLSLSLTFKSTHRKRWDARLGSSCQVIMSALSVVNIDALAWNQ